jgi:predicted transcriptional regulator|tara:strand:- start:438 stop:908 length:471 start_codon:yes stop_codon:yes gene_type:complete
MSDGKAPDAIISLEKRFIDAFVAGEKCVELRRRRPDLTSGTRIWFYSKVPEGKVRAYGILKSILELSAAAIWERFGNCLAISESELTEYLGGRDVGYVLQFSEVREVSEPVHLYDIRKVQPNFQPPQFFVYVRSDPLGSLLEALPIESAPASHPLS